jgi:hypothetical protein
MPGKHRFFFVGGVAVLRFQGFKEPDRRDIVAGFFMQTALADAVRWRDAEVAGRLRFGL